MTYKKKEGVISQPTQTRGRKKLPDGIKKKEKRVFLNQALIDWLIVQGDGNISTGVERTARRAGYEADKQAIIITE